MIKITSTQNPRIQSLTRLAKPGKRKEENLFVIEGVREISKVLKAGIIPIVSVYFCPEILSPPGKNLMNAFSPSVEIFEVNRHVYEKIAYRDNKDGIVVLATPVTLKLSDYKPKLNPLILVLETVEKPGNLGAILRTADAAGADAVVVCDPSTDIYNPNVIRSSLGCVFTVKVIPCSSAEAIRFFQENHIKIFTASLQTDVVYTSADFTMAAAIVLGSEAEGLTEPWTKNTDMPVKIPMAGEADSLNVSVSAGILVFEAIRQRREKSSRLSA